MNTVKIRNLNIGEGRPKIIVPITGTTKNEILMQAKALNNLSFDMIELRADYFNDIFDTEKVKELLKDLRDILKEIPLLMTFRTSNEGGEKSISNEEYLKLYTEAIKSGYIDMADVELFFDENTTDPILKTAHKKGVKVIMSNHDFEKTPPKEELILRMLNMQKKGADILKIAVMPHTSKDVLTLLEATNEMVTKYASQPVVTMSMSSLGVISRISGEIFGSAMTFGSAVKASAPGQLNVNDLNTVLNIISQYNENQN